MDSSRLNTTSTPLRFSTSLKLSKTLLVENFSTTKPASTLFSSPVQPPSTVKRKRNDLDDEDSHFEGSSRKISSNLNRKYVIKSMLPNIVPFRNKNNSAWKLLRSGDLLQFTNQQVTLYHDLFQSHRNAGVSPVGGNISKETMITIDLPCTLDDLIFVDLFESHVNNPTTTAIISTPISDTTSRTKEIVFITKQGFIHFWTFPANLDITSQSIGNRVTTHRVALTSGKDLPQDHEEENADELFTAVTLSPPFILCVSSYNEFYLIEKNSDSASSGKRMQITADKLRRIPNVTTSNVFYSLMSTGAKLLGLGGTHRNAPRRVQYYHLLPTILNGEALAVCVGTSIAVWKRYSHVGEECLVYEETGFRDIIKLDILKVLSSGLYREFVSKETLKWKVLDACLVTGNEKNEDGQVIVVLLSGTKNLAGKAKSAFDEDPEETGVVSMTLWLHVLQISLHGTSSNTEYEGQDDADEAGKSENVKVLHRMILHSNAIVNLRTLSKAQGLPSSVNLATEDRVNVKSNPRLFPMSPSWRIYVTWNATLSEMTETMLLPSSEYVHSLQIDIINQVFCPLPATAPVASTNVDVYRYPQESIVNSTLDSDAVVALSAIQGIDGVGAFLSTEEEEEVVLLSPPLPILLPTLNSPGSVSMQTPATMRSNVSNRITPLGHQQPSSDELMDFFQSILSHKLNVHDQVGNLRNITISTNPYDLNKLYLNLSFSILNKSPTSQFWGSMHTNTAPVSVVSATTLKQNAQISSVLKAFSSPTNNSIGTPLRSANMSTISMSAMKTPGSVSTFTGTFASVLTAASKFKSGLGPGHDQQLIATGKPTITLPSEIEYRVVQQSMEEKINQHLLLLESLRLSDVNHRFPEIHAEMIRHHQLLLFAVGLATTFYEHYFPKEANSAITIALPKHWQEISPLSSIAHCDEILFFWYEQIVGTIITMRSTSKEEILAKGYSFLDFFYMSVDKIIEGIDAIVEGITSQFMENDDIPMIHPKSLYLCYTLMTILLHATAHTTTAMFPGGGHSITGEDSMKTALIVHPMIRKCFVRLSSFFLEVNLKLFPPSWEEDEDKNVMASVATSAYRIHMTPMKSTGSKREKQECWEFFQTETVQRTLESFTKTILQGYELEAQGIAKVTSVKAMEEMSVSWKKEYQTTKETLINVLIQLQYIPLALQLSIQYAYFEGILMTIDWCSLYPTHPSTVRLLGPSTTPAVPESIVATTTISSAMSLPESIQYTADGSMNIQYPVLQALLHRYRHVKSTEKMSFGWKCLSWLEHHHRYYDLLVLGKDCEDILEDFLSSRKHLQWMHSMTKGTVEGYATATEALHAHAYLLAHPPTTDVLGSTASIAPTAPSATISAIGGKKGTVAQCNTLFSLAKLTTKLSEKLSAADSTSMPPPTPFSPMTTTTSKMGTPTPASAKQTAESKATKVPDWIVDDIQHQLTVIRIQQLLSPLIASTNAQAMVPTGYQSFHEDEEVPIKDSELLDRILKYLERYLGPLATYLRPPKHGETAPPMEVGSLIGGIEQAFGNGIMFRIIVSSFTLVDMMLKQRLSFGAKLRLNPYAKEIHYLQEEVSGILWEYILLYDLVDWTFLAHSSPVIAPSSSSSSSSASTGSEEDGGSVGGWSEEMIFPRVVEMLVHDLNEGKLFYGKDYLSVIFASSNSFLSLLHRSRVLTIAYDQENECIVHLNSGQLEVQENTRMKHLIFHCIDYLLKKHEVLRAINAAN